MTRLTYYQFLCLLILLIVPVAVLEVPHRLLHSAYHNAWLTVVTAIIPGYLLVLMYNYIIQKSHQSFPHMLDEHFGKIIGKSLAFIYIIAFFLSSAFTLRLLVDFMKLNVLPSTPISIFIICMLFTGFVAIKIGFNVIVRACEIIMPLGLVLTFLIVIIALFTNYQPERLLPLANVSLSGLMSGMSNTCVIFAKTMPVLLLAFWLPRKEDALVGLNMALLLFIAALTFVLLVLVITIGTIPSLSFVFPTFNMIRLARIGVFVQNLDIVFITVFIAGFFAAITIPWFMACFTIKELFNLRDYRLLAAPTSLIIGVLSIAICNNSLQVVAWSLYVIPILYGIAYIIIPLLIFLAAWIKTPKKPNAANPIQINSSE